MPRSALVVALLSRSRSGPWSGHYSIVAGRICLSIRAVARGGPTAGKPGGRYGRAWPDVPDGRSTVVDSVTESTLAREKKIGK